MIKTIGAIFLLILLLSVLFSSCIRSVTPLGTENEFDDVMGEKPQFVGNVTVTLGAEDDADGPTTCILYGIRVLPISGFLPYGFDEKTFVIPKVIADGHYHHISTWTLNNPGVIYEKIEIRFDEILSKHNETTGQIQQLKIGERSDTDDISIKIFINENSTENKNYITLSDAVIGKRFTLDELVIPGGSTTLYFYMKSYNKTISGNFQSLFQTQILALGTIPEVTPIYNLDFELFDIKANDFTFNLDFALSLTPDVKIGDIKISYPNNDMWEPLVFTSISQQKNIYHLKNIRLKSHGNSIEYPFDEYEEIIELKAINEANTKYINESLEFYACSKTTADWHITVSAKGNYLYFTFARNHERNVFLLLCSINFIMILLGIIIIILKWKKIKLNKKVSLRFFPWVSLSFFGLTYIVFYSPRIDNIGNLILISTIITLFVLRAICKKFENG